PLRKKFDEIVQKLSDNPSDSFERLVPPENNYYFRRLNIQHRVVYSIDEEHKIVYIYSAGNHYE
ncbi:Txe/YoeB family addiction module toxin, partial [Lactiplantibacillus plantarum]|uniref:Txe/YoeB family addiction module toxin n=1 Tax=Lactiplantibacillus plantarum TaxID=1590 RepID=UPI003D688FFF